MANQNQSNNRSKAQQGKAHASSNQGRVQSKSDGRLKANRDKGVHVSDER